MGEATFTSSAGWHGNRAMASTFAKQLWNLIQTEDAVTSVEYAVILALILVAIMGSIGSFGQQQGAMWNGIEANLRDHGFAAQ